jgi:hypothetical protein
MLPGSPEAWSRDQPERTIGSRGRASRKSSDCFLNRPEHLYRIRDGFRIAMTARSAAIKDSVRNFLISLWQLTYSLYVPITLFLPVQLTSQTS